MKITEARIQEIAEMGDDCPSEVSELLVALTERDALIAKMAEKALETNAINKDLRAQVVECILVNENTMDYMALHPGHSLSRELEKCPKCQQEMPLEDLVREHTCMGAILEAADQLR